MICSIRLFIFTKNVCKEYKRRWEVQIHQQNCLGTRSYLGKALIDSQHFEFNYWLCIFCLRRWSQAIKFDFSLLNIDDVWSQKQRVETPATTTAIYALIFAALSEPVSSPELLTFAFFSACSSTISWRKTSATGLKPVITLPQLYDWGSLKSCFLWSR